MLPKPFWLFAIKNRAEGFVIIYALVQDTVCLKQYRSVGSQLLVRATTGAMFLGDAKIRDAIRLEQDLA